jgi:hypothetical protein
MPRFDGTGPMGQGPMTGRGMGYCAVPLSQLGPARRPTVTPYYPAPALPPWTAGYGVPRIAYARPWRAARFGRGRGFNRRGARGRWW